jgi:hypothetical protein
MAEVGAEHGRIPLVLMGLRSTLAARPVTPQTARRIHLGMLIGWIAIGLPASYFLRHSLAWLVALSVYAIVVGHWSGWSAERPSEVVES